MKEKQRLDVYLVSKNIMESRSLAKAAVIAGQVVVNGKKVTKPGYLVFDEDIHVKPFTKYVSRGALKLEKALNVFDLSLKGKKAIDIGAGSGGFSQVLLENGVAEVVAVDVGYGQYSWKLRNDPRITLIERTNIRYLEPERIGKKADIAVIDLSFISVTKVIENIKNMLTLDADVVILIKPQFEAGKGQVPKGGVVKEKEVHVKVLSDFIMRLKEKEIYLKNLTYSPIAGAKGNIEFLGHFSLKKSKIDLDIVKVVTQARGEHYED